MVTAAIKSNIDSASYVANRIPNAQEHRQVRGMILDAFIDYYGKEIAVTCFSNLLSEENKSTSIMVGDLQQVFAKLDALSFKENMLVGRNPFATFPLLAHRSCSIFKSPYNSIYLKYPGLERSFPEVFLSMRCFSSAE